MKRFWNISIVNKISTLVCGAVVVLTAANAQARGGGNSNHGGGNSNHAMSNNNFKSNSSHSFSTRMNNVSPLQNTPKNMQSLSLNTHVNHGQMTKKQTTIGQFARQHSSHTSNLLSKPGNLHLNHLSNHNGQFGKSSFMGNVQCWPHNPCPPCGSHCSGGWCWPTFGGCWNSGIYTSPWCGSYFDGCYNSGVTVVEVPTPVTVAAAPQTSNVDLELVGVQLLDAGDDATGPAFRIAVRNNGDQDSAAFDVAAVATNGENPDQKTPFAVQRIENVPPGQTATVEVRLPVKANQMNLVDGQAQPFTTLFVGADPKGEVRETTKDNNIVRVPRIEIPSAGDLAASK